MRPPIPNRVIEAAQAGDTGALALLLDLTQPDIRRYAQRYCARAGDIDDAMQDTLIALYRHIGHLQKVAAFSGWLMRIVQRACYRALSPLFGFETLEDSAEKLLAARPLPDLRIDLARSLAALPEVDRRILLLRDGEQQTLADIARRVNLSVPAVKSRLHRARAVIRQNLLARATEER
ncbi:MAG: RNA polymerase sigma factor [Elstera sp.]|jgi:RNA polymerase sigma factor (sigma-70 family)